MQMKLPVVCNSHFGLPVSHLKMYWVFYSLHFYVVLRLANIPSGFYKHILSLKFGGFNVDETLAFNSFNDNFKWYSPHSCLHFKHAWT